LEFTKTQQRILDVLSDGLRHQNQELKELLPDQEADGLAKHKTVIVHIVHIRKKLRPIGQDILCEFYNRKKYYRRVRLYTTE